MHLPSPLPSASPQSHTTPPGGFLQVLDINKADTCLTLTSGGCNALNLIVHGAGKVHAVDCNPAQSSLLELKATAIRRAALDSDMVFFVGFFFFWVFW